MRLKINVLKKISWKLTIIYALIFSFVLLILNTGILFGVRYFLIQQARVQVNSSMSDTLSEINAPYDTGEPNDTDGPNGAQPNVNKVQNDLDHAQHVVSDTQPVDEMNIKIIDAKGKLLASTDKFRLNDIKSTSNIGATVVYETKNMHLIVRNEAVNSGGHTIAYLQVVYDMKREYFFIKVLFVLMAIADAAGIIFSIFAGLLISKRILNPIDKITKTAKAISISDLNSRIEVGEADDELSRLAKTFNEMIERLKVSFERQSRFVSDASHELRTPISVIQGYADLIDRWGKNDAGVLDESIKAIRNETLGMTSLIERLLFLARGDSSRIKLQIEMFDLGKLIAEVISESRLIAGERSLACKVDGPIEMNADQKMIKQMLRALIDNSIKFTLPDGIIEAKAYKEKNQTVIIVKDNGIGIPPEEIDHIFDRFYVVDKARSKEKGGSGLGLSIVKSIVDTHEGTIFARSPQGGGTEVVAKFPTRRYKRE